MKKASLLRRIGVPAFALVVTTLFLFGTAVVGTVQRLLRDGVRQHVDAAAELLRPSVARLLAADDREAVRRLCAEAGTKTRVTVIGADGTVLGDSMGAPEDMDNHVDRPEIQAARRTGVGIDRRYSHSVHCDFVYLAHRIGAPDGTIAGYLRVAAPTAVYDRARREAIAWLLAVLCLILPLAGVVAIRITRGLAKPLADMRHGAERFAAGDFSTPVRTAHSREVDALTMCLNLMAEQLAGRMHELVRRRNETEAVFRGMSEGVVAADADQRILGMNHAAGALLGVDPETARGQKLVEVARVAALLGAVERTLARAESTDTQATLADDDSERTVDIHVSPLPDHTGAVAVLHDTTRLRRLESMRRDFVANVSHELRTPITAIAGFVETLADGAIDDPHVARRFLSAVERHSQRLGRIVEDLLLLSKLDSSGDDGMAGASRDHLRVLDMLCAAMHAVEKHAQDRGTRVAIEVPSELVCDVFAGLVQPAITNLIDNAIKYSPEHSLVRVEATQTGSETRISVTDEGPGIAPEHRARVFERFYRIDKGRSRDLGGTGLGLAIVKHVMGVHGGRVELESEVGRGSTFTLVFPHGTAANGPS